MKRLFEKLFKKKKEEKGYIIPLKGSLVGDISVAIGQAKEQQNKVKEK
jgi:hypothetical protein